MGVSILSPATDDWINSFLTTGDGLLKNNVGFYIFTGFMHINNRKINTNFIKEGC